MYWVALNPHLQPSIFFFFASQLVDVQYFDGRISIMAWILLACLKNIIDEQKFKANDLNS